MSNLEKQLPTEPWTDELRDEYIELVEAFAAGRAKELGDEAHPEAFAAGASVILYATGGAIPPKWYFNALRGNDPFGEVSWDHPGSQKEVK
jgi:hypothetical protein